MEKIGWFITGLWTIVFGILIYLKFNSVINMNPNEWGDFLAGFAAPLALLWLIIGYRLQKSELNMNTRALESQQRELASQVNALLEQNETFKIQNAAMHKYIDSIDKLSQTIDEAATNIIRYGS